MKNNRFHSYIKAAVLLLAFAGFFATEAHAQFSVGVETNSRYVWRGFDFGDSPSIMPSAAYTAGGLEIGVWGAYATNGDPAGTEIDLYASYTASTDAGNFGLSITDYTFPAANVDYFDSEQHFVELGLHYDTAINDMAGWFLSGNVFVANDDDDSIYIETGFDFALEEVNLSLFSGFTPGESGQYGTTEFSFINVGAGVSKSIELESGREIGVSTSLITNPHAQKAYLVFGLGFGF